jgi:hypothetical protein
MEINHICTESLQKTDSQRLRPWLDTSASLVFFGQKLPFSRCLHQGLIFTYLKDFLYGSYRDYDQQLKFAAKTAAPTSNFGYTLVGSLTRTLDQI